MRKPCRSVAHAILCVLIPSLPALAATLHVPADYPTIQSCIDAAVSGQDECVVAPGTYNELINFLGKAITLRSSHGHEVTTITSDFPHYNLIANSDAFDGIHLLDLTFVDVTSDNTGKLTMKNCTVVNSTFSNYWAKMSITSSNFRSSSVIAGEVATLNIQDCVFQGSLGGGGSDLQVSSNH